MTETATTAILELMLIQHLLSENGNNNCPIET